MDDKTRAQAKIIEDATNRFRASTGLPPGYKTLPGGPRVKAYRLIGPDEKQVAQFDTLEQFGAFLRAVVEEAVRDDAP